MQIILQDSKSLKDETFLSRKQIIDDNQQISDDDHTLIALGFVRARRLYTNEKKNGLT